MDGRRRRLARLLSPGGCLRMVPLDHGVSLGPLPGLEDPAAVARSLAAAGATCFTAHKGLVPLLADGLGPGTGLLLHLSASSDASPDPHDKRLVATVEEALRLGCDGVSLHVNVGSATEARQVEEAGRVASACDQWGVPLVTMAYPRGPKVKDPRDPKLVAHAARLAFELGADAVKVPYTGSAASFRAVVDAVPIPVLAAGGPAADGKAFLSLLRGARQAGARGFCAGRNLLGADGTQRMRELAKAFP